MPTYKSCNAKTPRAAKLVRQALRTSFSTAPFAGGLGGTLDSTGAGAEAPQPIPALITVYVAGGSTKSAGRLVPHASAAKVCLETAFCSLINAVSCCVPFECVLPLLLSL